MTSEKSQERPDGRQNDQLRSLKITRNYLIWPEGSVLVEHGNTKVIVTVSLEDNVPNFLKESGKGWITAEYDMLPRATDKRNSRSRDKGTSGRSQEIQRLIGRSVRAAFNTETLGEITLRVDADVIQADGGTRCASINGAFIAGYDALKSAISKGIIPKMPPFKVIGAVSVGLFGGVPRLDLCYTEDSKADVDLNLIMDEDSNLIEIQGTAEKNNFSRAQLNQLLDIGEKGLKEIIVYLKTLI